MVGPFCSNAAAATQSLRALAMQEEQPRKWGGGIGDEDGGSNLCDRFTRPALHPSHRNLWLLLLLICAPCDEYGLSTQPLLTPSNTADSPQQITAKGLLFILENPIAA